MHQTKSFSVAFNGVANIAYELAKKDGYSEVEPSHLFIALLRSISIDCDVYQLLAAHSGPAARLLGEFTGPYYRGPIGKAKNHGIPNRDTYDAVVSYAYELGVLDDKAKEIECVHLLLALASVANTTPHKFLKEHEFTVEKAQLTLSKIRTEKMKNKAADQAALKNSLGEGAGAAPHLELVKPIEMQFPCADAYLALVHNLIQLGVSPDLGARCALEVFRNLQQTSPRPETLL